MKKVLLPLLVAFFSCALCKAQFNDYKYVVVPVKFDAFKKQNQYKTSTLVKFLLTQKGLNVVYDDNLPKELATNRCLALYADLLDESTMFSTKTSVAFRDCYGTEMYRTRQGSSKKKIYEESYREALQEAMNSMIIQPYEYEEKELIKKQRDTPEEETITLNFANDIVRLDQQKKEYKKKGDETITLNFANDVKQLGAMNEILYAQAVENGFQLVDTTPKVVCRMTKSAVPDVYFAQGELFGFGLVFKKEGKWFLELPNESGNTLKELDIKF